MLLSRLGKNVNRDWFLSKNEVRNVNNEDRVLSRPEVRYITALVRMLTGMR